MHQGSRRVSLSILWVALLAGCANGQLTTTGTIQGCGPANCGGCCAPNGTCITPSNTIFACGSGGGSCSVCGSTQSCSSGVCINNACSGCLDASNTCQLGTSSGACGQNGNACASCSSGQRCVNGSCESNSCVPNCVGLQCGSDGCGGSCGTCPAGQTCNSSDQCASTCVPQCSGKQCGSDGCGGTCGSCPIGDACNGNGQCSGTCTPQCSGKQCGSDGCGGTCGTCPSGQSCNASSQCAPATTGTVGPNGGTVPSLYFAVIGDTRPGSNNSNGSYPTAIITKLYQDIENLNPKPQFVITTGDYQFDDPGSGNAAIQIGYYKTASLAYTGGPIFSAMGNHECNGYTASNMNLSNGQCDGVVSDNYSEWFNAFVAPLGKSTPYYTIPINATDGSWTSKFIIVACNAWDSTQQSWLQAQLAQPTTYTFLVRHEDPTANTGPCVNQMDTLLKTATYNALIVGHVHQFCSGSLSSVTKCTYPASNVKFFVVGNGGANTNGDGYVTVQQNGSTFSVTDYDYSTNTQVASFTFQ